MTYLLLPRFHRESPVNEYTRNIQTQNKWTDRQLEEEVNMALTALFQNEYYKFQPYITDAEVGGKYITVLGRAVQPEEAISEPATDSLVLFKAV